MDPGADLKIAVAGLALAAALHDLAVRTVPNAIPLGIAGCGVLLAVLQDRLGVSVAVGACVLAAGAALWLRGAIGGADAKLLAAAALVLPPAGVPDFLATTALAGGILCLPYLAGPVLCAAPPSRRPASLLARLLRCERWRLRRRGPLPYAVAIAAGLLLILPRGG